MRQQPRPTSDSPQEIKCSSKEAAEQEHIFVGLDVARPHRAWILPETMTSHPLCVILGVERRHRHHFAPAVRAQGDAVRDLVRHRPHQLAQLQSQKLRCSKFASTNRYDGVTTAELALSDRSTNFFTCCVCKHTSIAVTCDDAIRRRIDFTES